MTSNRTRSHTDVSAINSTIAVADGLLARRGLALEIGWISVPRNVIKRRTPPDNKEKTMDAKEKANNTQTVLQSVTPSFMPTDGEVMTLRIDYPPGDPGSPPHRHLGGPCFGYVLEGEMVFEVQGEPPRVIKAGEAFWEPGGEIIHYQDANNRTDTPLRFIVTMMMAPDHKVLVFVDDDELTQSGWLSGHPVSDLGEVEPVPEVIDETPRWDCRRCSDDHSDRHLPRTDGQRTETAGGDTN